jgi:hypothetical protein
MPKVGVFSDTHVILESFRTAAIGSYRASDPEVSRLDPAYESMRVEQRHAEPGSVRRRQDLAPDAGQNVFVQS